MSRKQLSTAGFGTFREAFGIATPATRPSAEPAPAAPKRSHKARDNYKGNWVPDDFDFVMPGQLRRAIASSTGERRLMLAIVDDASRLLAKRGRSTGKRCDRAIEETLAWVNSTSRSWLFDFENIADELGLDPDRARRTMLAVAAQVGDGQRARPRVCSGVRTRQTRGARRSVRR